MNRFTNVTKCNSCDPTKARFTMEDEMDVYWIDINIETRTAIDGTFKIGSYPQALMLIQAMEYLNDREDIDPDMR